MQIDAENLGRMEEKIEWLATTWLGILSRVSIKDKHLFVLNPAIASKVVYHYAGDLEFLKRRYHIADKVQAPKIAGLMAGAILKYRPVVPIDGWQLGIEENYINEFFAVYHGVCVCANHSKSGLGNRAMAALMARPYFRQWLNRFIFHIRERNYTSESLVMVFETLCFAAFPENMDEGEKKDEDI
jgi:hypothetical protein